MKVYAIKHRAKESYHCAKTKHYFYLYVLISLARNSPYAFHRLSSMSNLTRQWSVGGLAYSNRLYGFLLWG
jgi:hypothetical protein